MRERLLSALTWAAAGAVVPVALLHFVGKREAHLSSDVHFWAVMLSAFAATGAAVALTAVGARRSDGRVVLVATAFSAMAALLAVHGLATPGQLGAPERPRGSHRRDHAPRGRCDPRAHRRARALAHLADLHPDLAPGGSPRGHRHSEHDRPRRSQSRARCAGDDERGRARATGRGARVLRDRMLYVPAAPGCSRAAAPTWSSWSASSGSAPRSAPALTQSYQELGWWLGHSFEVIGIGFVGAVVAWDLHRTAQSRTLLGDLQARQLVSAEEAFLGLHVLARSC